MMKSILKKIVGLITIFVVTVAVSYAATLAVKAAMNWGLH